MVQNYLFVLEEYQDHDNGEPVEDITQYGTNRSIVGPTEDSIKNRPARVIEFAFGVAAVQVPDIPSDIIGAWAITCCAGIIYIGTQPSSGIVKKMT